MSKGMVGGLSTWSRWRGEVVLWSIAMAKRPMACIVYSVIVDGLQFLHHATSINEPREMAHKRYHCQLALP